MLWLEFNFFRLDFRIGTSKLTTLTYGTQVRMKLSNFKNKTYKNKKDMPKMGQDKFL